MIGALAVGWALIGAPGRALSADSTSVAAAIPDTAMAGLRELGLENLNADTTRGVLAYENRRYRHAVEALGHVHLEAGTGVVALERRLGLNVAALTLEGAGDDARFRVRYPSDAGFPRNPPGPSLARTSRSLDFVVGPLISYELGRTDQPVQFKLEIEPRLRYNPWPGARATASLLIPVYDDFQRTELNPEDENVRPGLLTLEQFLWAPRVALTSATVGVFGDNRYGISFGAARPFFDGAVLVDAQADYTGFIAFESEGVVYSELNQWSSFLGVAWRPPFLDLQVRGRIAQFLYGDQGEEFEVRRSMGDVDFGFFVVRGDGQDTKGVRFTLPIPPMERSTGSVVRFQPIERFPFSYRNEAVSIGVQLSGVASREDFLRQANAPSLAANRDRYRRGLGEPDPEKKPAPIEWMAQTGMTGFINTPWAGGLPDRSIELGCGSVPKEASWDGRGQYPNEPWHLTIGLLPRVEVALRFTRVPGLVTLNPDPDNELTTDTDHMASGRLTLLTPKQGRPGVAVGIEDVEGTRRFHATYVVAGLPFAILSVQNRFSLGYAPSVLTAARHVLEGGFGAFEVSPWRAVAARVEYDTEKWNAGIGVGLKYGLRLRASALDLKSLSFGASWYHEL